MRTLEEITEVFDAEIITGEVPSGKQLYALGSYGDGSVGIPNFDLTPYFETPTLLRQFVESAKGWAHINQAAAEEFLTDWDAEAQDWAECQY